MKILGILLVATVTITGCATNSDVSKLQGQLDTIKADVATVSIDASSAKLSAEKASASAHNSLIAAQAAEAAITATGVKLDKLFTRLQYK